MSAVAHPHSATPAGEHGAHEGKFHIFVQVAMLLAVITGIEILIIYLPLVKWLVTSTLVVLSLVKFMFVIFIFMHLRWDKMFCTILFFIGLTLAGGTMWALLMIHSAEASKPVGAAYDQG
ncbi:MAG TPA: cytochrome C oxidase subunit IV family protein [Opitutaceae bacterium]